MEVDFASINKGFSKQAEKFDDEDNSNVILQWTRRRIYAHVQRHLIKGSKILELNAGTGIDAMYLVSEGYNVHATDLSGGMIKQLRRKIEANKLQQNLSVQQLSFTQLQDVKNGPFDYIFSNFGGLNCIPDLQKVSKSITQKINTGSYITLVLMPRICPWEMAAIFKGKFKYAFRRLRKGGTLANLEGEKFMTFYFSPQQVIDSFGVDYKLVELEGLATFCPPPYRNEFAKRHPLFFRFSLKMDEMLCHRFPFNQWADHFIITLQYLP